MCGWGGVDLVGVHHAEWAGLFDVFATGTAVLVDSDQGDETNAEHNDGEQQGEGSQSSHPPQTTQSGAGEVESGKLGRVDERWTEGRLVLLEAPIADPDA